MSSPAEFLHALRLREPLRADGATNAVRLLDGTGDGAAFDGLFIDDFAGRWLVQTTRPGQSPPEWLRALDETVAPRSIYWKRLDSRGEHQQAPTLWAGEPVAVPFAVREHGLSYLVDFQSGYSQGIFLDQRDNRLSVRHRLRAGASLLNCFAYTCAFSVVAAAAGAHTVSVDLSRRSLDWGKENFRLNGFDPGGHEFYAGDVIDLLARFARRGRRFEGLVFDPPTFSRNREGKVFRVEHDFATLVRLAVPLLASDGWLLCSTNARILSPADFRRLIVAGLPAEGRGWHTEAAAMPADFTGAPYLRTWWVSQPA